MFAVIRSKGGHRDNPDPCEFRIALRQVMVDQVLMTSKGTNCQEDLDEFLLNFSSKPADSYPLIFSSSSSQPQKKELPAVINLVKSVSMAEAMQIENVLSYISGYIAYKMSKLICNECIIHLTSSSADASHLSFIKHKQYAGATSGLQKPSSALVKSLGVFESISQDFFKKHMRNDSIKQTLITLLLDVPSSKELKSPACNCKTAEYC